MPDATTPKRSTASRRQRRNAFDVREQVDALLDPACYPHRPESVRLRETLISAVFLAGELVYKLKKPVNLGFVDYTTLARRRRFCRLEVELNRRLAETIYLGAVPLASSDIGPRFEAPGRPLDWAVKMRRVPDEALWSNRLTAGMLGADDMQRAGELLAGFHERVPVVRSAKLLDAADEAWDGNLRELARFVPDLLSREELTAIDQAGDRLRARLAPVLRRRLREGRFVDGHGDLRMEHLCDFDGRLQALDCVEFNPDLRRVDAASDLAFLLMDLDRYGREDLALDLAATNLRASGDASAPLVDRFYRAERALVRAKVDALALERPGRTPDDVARLRGRARRLIELALGYVGHSTPPVLAVVWGLSGSGKTYLATRIAAGLGGVWLSTDYVRKRAAREQLTARMGADTYTNEARLAVYARMHRAAGWYLRRGFAVVLDGTYLDTAARASAERLAVRTGVPAVALTPVCAPETLRERLGRRQHEATASDAGWRVVEAQLRTYDRQDFAGIASVRLDGEADEATVTRAALNAIAEVMKGKPVPAVSEAHSPDSQGI